MVSSTYLHAHEENGMAPTVTTGEPWSHPDSEVSEKVTRREIV